MKIQSQFDYDFANSMVDVGHGCDPYNHVGDNVVAELIGVVRIAEPILEEDVLSLCHSEAVIGHWEGFERISPMKVVPT